MEYTYPELLSYLLIYSFLGWLVEVFIMAVKQRRFCNRGFFNLPFCLSYGVIMDILIVLLPTFRRQYIFQFIVVLIVSSTITFLSGALAKYVSRTELWKYEENNLFGAGRKKLLQGIAAAAIFYLIVELIHPLIFVCIHMLPRWLLLTGCGVFGGLFLLDSVSIFYAIRRKNHAVLDGFRKGMQEREQKFNDRIYNLVWGRLEKAYPNITAAGKAAELESVELEGAENDSGESGMGDKKYVFAQGICIDKLIWVFLISALLGDIIETIYCRLVGGVWMSRSSVIYGPFSIVWGIGAVLLTVILRRLTEKEDRYVFFAGFLIGGVYEYACSVFTEVFFGTVFWDYSHMPLNIGGRTNVLFCIFWGILSVIWVKVIYPRMSRLIEKIPPIAGKISTWVIVVFMCCNALISAAALVRYTERVENQEATNVIEEFIDRHYEDELIEFIWPNMKMDWRKTSESDGAS